MELRGGILQMYQGIDGARYPRNLKLFQAAHRFAQEQLAKPLDLLKAQMVFVVWIENGEEIEVLSLGCMQQVWDAFVFRTKPSKFSTRATKELRRRMNDCLANAGVEGEVLLHFDPDQTEEQRCPQADEWLRKAGARPAHRWTVKIK